MAGIISKRQAARNERMLQDLLTSVPGNDRCADCSARNPAWASWSLGIFLCMTCAGLHRKMGTHISKVKSLTMDSWTPDQVDNMKRTGNVASNRVFNPQNVRCDIPTDADEVSGVMERFIRQKYEHKAFMASSRPRSQTTGGASLNSIEDQPPPLPPKPAKKFGFSLRSASATQPKYTPPLSPALTGSDGRSSPPRMNKPSRIFGSAVGNNQEDNFDGKLASLREMGFPDNRRNSTVLKSVNGNVERAIETLVRLGEAVPTPSGMLTPVSASSSNVNGIQVERQRPSQQKQPASSSNPFDALDLQPPRRAVTQPLPSAFPDVNPAQQSYNPFLANTASVQPQAQPQQQPLQDAFQGMQITNQQPQQYMAQNNPFMPQQFQQQQQQQQQQQPPVQTPAYTGHSYIQPQQTSNPFLRQTKSQTFIPSNPFGLQQQQPPPPLPQNPWLAQSQVQTPQALYQQPQQDFFSVQPQQQAHPQQPQQQSYQQQQQPQPLQPQQTSNPFLSQQQQQQQQQPQPTSNHNPYQIPPSQPLQNESYNYQAVPVQQNQQQQQQQQQFYQPQQLNQPQSRFDRSTIMALYNYPQLAPSRPLQSLPENGVADNNMQQQQQQQLQQPQRSATMPMTTGSMNPFGPGPSQQQQQSFGGHAAAGASRHVTHDSVDFVGLGGGRQSPDAFANLSARYAR